MLALVSLSLLGLALRGAAASELHSRDALRSLLVARQAGLPPVDGCAQSCDPFLTGVESCLDVACICAPANVASLAQCMACAVGEDPSVQVEAQRVLDNFRASCGLPPVPVGAAPTAASPTPTVAATPQALSTPPVAGGETSNTGTGTRAAASKQTDPFALNGAGRVASGVGVVGLLVAAVIGLA
jgi:hypothetical protein